MPLLLDYQVAMAFFSKTYFYVQTNELLRNVKQNTLITYNRIIKHYSASTLKSFSRDNKTSISLKQLTDVRSLIPSICHQYPYSSSC